MKTYHSNMERRWVLSLHHKILFPITTIIIMEAFINKMRKLKGIRKLILIEEAWKAIASANMADYIKYLYKTVRKYFGEAIVVTQEVEDIISSPIEPTPGSRPLQFIIKMNQKNPNNNGNAARNAFVPISGSNIPERDDITASTAICPRPGTSFAPLPNNSRTPTIITAANIHVVNMEFVTGKPNTSNNCSPLISAQNPSVANTVCIAPAIVHVFKNFKIPL